MITILYDATLWKFPGLRVSPLPCNTDYWKRSTGLSFFTNARKVISVHVRYRPAFLTTMYGTL